MSKSNIRTCTVCHKEYKFCPKCNEDKGKPSWMLAFCSANCRDIYDVTSGFENGNLTAEDAGILIDSLDLSGLDGFGESYKASIAKIADGNAGSVGSGTDAEDQEAAGEYGYGGEN